MEKKSFLIYFDSRPMLEKLSDEERGKLLLELLYYGEEVKEKRTTVMEYLEGNHRMLPETWMAFGFVAGAIYRDTMKWLHTQETKAAKKRLAADRGMPATQPFAVPGSGLPSPGDRWGLGGDPY